jgi:hypothetical protein
VKEQQKLHNLRIYYVAIQSELDYLIGVIVLEVQPAKTRQNPAGYGSVLGLEPEITAGSGLVRFQNRTVCLGSGFGIRDLRRFGFSTVPEQEPNRTRNLGPLPTVAICGQPTELAKAWDNTLRDACAEKSPAQ